MSSSHATRPHVLVDLDRTLFDTGRFIDSLWQAIALEYRIDTAKEQKRAEQFYHYSGDWYDYHFFDHIATIPEIAAELAGFADRVRPHMAESFVFEDAKITVGLYDEILTFGNTQYQEFKLSFCPELTGIPVTIIQEVKGDYVPEHYGEPVVLIDDKHLEGTLGDSVEFYLIDRNQRDPIVRHRPGFHSVNSLARLKDEPSFADR